MSVIYIYVVPQKKDLIMISEFFMTAKILTSVGRSDWA